MTPPRASIYACAVGAAGAGLFWAVGFPMPFLTGPAAMVSLAALAGLPVALPAWLRDTAFLVLGLNIGAGVTPEVLATAAQWPLSLAALTGALVLTIWTSARVLERGFGFDRVSATLAAIPGHLSFVIGLSTDRAVPMERIAVVQSVRVLLLTLALPAALVSLGLGAEAPLERAAPAMTAVHFAASMALSLALGVVFRRLRVPAAFLLAAMAVSAVGHGSALTPGAPWPALVLSAFAVMGTVIGTRFAGLDPRALWQSGLAGVVTTVLATGIALGAALGVGWIGGFDPLLLLVAYAPGGVEAMAAISVQLGLASAVVAAHHVVRLLILSVLVPVLMARLPDPAPRAPHGPR